MSYIWGRQAVAALIVAVVSTGGFVVEAGGLYWSDERFSDGEWHFGLMAANLDGSNAQVMIPGRTRGIAVDPVGRKIYWAQLSPLPPTLRRANIDGSGQEILYSIPYNSSISLALDREAGWVYMSAHGGEWCDGIVRYRMDGAGPREPILPNVCSGGVAVDAAAGKLYWSDLHNENTIKRANLDGSEVETLLPEAGSPGALALDLPAGKIYWSQKYGPGIVMRADLDGSNVETIVPGEDRSRGMALDLHAGKLYWTINEDSLREIRRANLDGSDAELLLEVAAVWQIAIDPTPGDVVVPAVSTTGVVVLLLVLLAISTRWLRRASAANRRSA